MAKMPAKHSGTRSICGCSKPRCSDFGFNTSDPGVFLRSQVGIEGVVQVLAMLRVVGKWSTRSRYIFLMYRVLFACYLVFCESYILYKYIPLHGCYTLLFLSKWTFLVLTCYSLLAMFGAIYHKPSTVRVIDPVIFQAHHPQHDLSTGPPPKPPRHRRHSSLTYPTPLIFKLSWLLFNISLVLLPFITAVFWTSVYSGPRHYDEFSSDATERTLYFVMDIQEHGVAAFLVYLDLLVSATPIRVAHLIYGVLYAGIYIAFSAGYWALDGSIPDDQTVLYPYLDWDNLVPTAYYIAGSLGVIVVLHIVAYCVYTLRMSCYRCVCRRRNELPLQLPRQPQMEYIELGRDEDDGNIDDAPLADFESF